MRDCLKNKIQILLLTSILAATPVFAASVEYTAGMNAYNKGNYPFAKVLFQKAVKLDGSDVNSRYMLCQILVKEKQYEQAKKEYQKIISIAPKSKAAEYAKAGISNIDKYMGTDKNKDSSKEKTLTVKAPFRYVPYSEVPDYLKNAYRNGLSYKRERGMMRVYIEPDSVYEPLMKQAYSEWQSAISNYVIFSYAGSEDNATDVIKFSKTAAALGQEEAGYCQYKTEGTKITGSSILIKTTNHDGTPFPKALIYHTMLHEIGHSLGIMGHSPYQGDAMAQGAKYIVPHLTERDKHTAELLYQSYGPKPNEDEVRAAKMAELEDITKRVPNDPSGFIDLGDESFAAGNYVKALECYNQAERIKPSSAIYYRQTKVYKAINDIDNLIVTYKKILMVEPSNKSALGAVLSIYAQQGRVLEGRGILDEFVGKNPDKKNDTDITKYRNIFSDRNIKNSNIVNKRMQYLMK